MNNWRRDRHVTTFVHRYLKKKSPKFQKRLTAWCCVLLFWEWLDDQNLFTVWLKHLAAYADASVENPVLLVMDNHASHTSLVSTIQSNCVWHSFAFDDHSLWVTFNLQESFQQGCYHWWSFLRSWGMWHLALELTFLNEDNTT